MEFTDFDEGLFEELRQLRLIIAREDGVPAFVVFHNSTLQQMAYRIPLSRASLSSISGVGPAKLEKWGERFLAVIRSYAALHGLRERPIHERRSYTHRATDGEKIRSFQRDMIRHRTASSDDLKRLLKRHFGHAQFRGQQESIVTSVLSGEDALVVMPTGGGKSLCYQLPALVFDGLTLVVSPLIALMADQVNGLNKRGIAAAFINSSQSREEILQIQRLAEGGHLRLLYVAPERLAKSGFRRFLARLKVDLVAIDEAHCISVWGHDFRPDYRRLGELRNRLAGVPFLALTATATKQVQQDILKQLRLAKPRQFIHSFNRANLNYNVLPKHSPQRDFAVLRTLLQKNRGDSAIIYRTKRKSVEELATQLRHAGIDAVPYHAGLGNKARGTIQESFMSGQVPVIVATIAFGMGIDKSNIRLLVHYDLPMSLESYYQETGRAGRDGNLAHCVLFFSEDDRKTPEYFISQMKDATQRCAARKKLQQVVQFCELKGCRREYILRYFGEQWMRSNCGCCDNCLRLGQSDLKVPMQRAQPEAQGDMDVLLSIRDELAGSCSLNWSDQIPVHKWQGVRLDTSTGIPQVTGLVLDGVGLTGIIPDKLGRISTLRILDLMNNMLRGLIPQRLGNLRKLEELYLSNNRLTGSIPSALGNLGMLEELSLDGNELVGAIPPEIGNLIRLEGLLLSGNEFAGNIPSELGKLKRLEVLTLSDNKLGGAIPESLEGLNHLEVLHLAENQLRGCIPNSLANVKDNDLDRLGLPFCRSPRRSSKKLELTGDFAKLLKIRDSLVGTGTVNWHESVPIQEWEGIRIDSTKGPPRVTSIRLPGKNLDGTLPPAVASLTSLSLLYLRDNRLKGQIPPELGSLENLKWLSLSDNQLTGAIPSELGKLKRLERLFLRNNKLAGQIPPVLGTLEGLTWLFLSHNNLNGTIPETFGKLSNLEWLDLSHNRLNGSVPPELEALKKLKSLSVSNNYLSGCIPRGLGNIEANDLAMLGLPFCGPSSSNEGKMPPERKGPHRRRNPLKRLIQTLQNWGPED